MSNEDFIYHALIHFGNNVLKSKKTFSLLGAPVAIALIKAGNPARKAANIPEPCTAASVADCITSTTGLRQSGPEP